jgi:hypothetical protein
MTIKKDIWHYRQKLKDNNRFEIKYIFSARQVIIDIGDDEGPYIGAASETGNYIYLLGLYEWPDSPEPKRVAMEDIKRWCYFSDFAKMLMG